MTIFINQSIMNLLFTRYQIISNFIVMNIAIMTLTLRIMEPEDVVKDLMVSCIVVISFSLGCLLFAYVQVAIMNIKTNELILSSRIIQNSKVKLLYQEMLESLEEAILVIKDDKIEFKNQLLTSIIKRIKMDPNDAVSRISEKILDIKFI